MDEMTPKCKAKMMALKNLRKTASDMMKDGMTDKVKKVTVAAPDKQSLKAGLEKAEELVEKDPQELSMMDDMAEDIMEDDDTEVAEEETPETEEELDAMIAKLMEKKAALKA